MLTKLKLIPGVNRNNTNYAASGSWIDCNRIRFQDGEVQPIGGWQVRVDPTTSTPLDAAGNPHTDNMIRGNVRSIFRQIDNGGASYTFYGATGGVFVEDGGVIYDITPLRATATLGNPFVSTAGSKNLQVVDVNHGAAVGDYVKFSGASTFNGMVADYLNRTWIITSVIDVDNYTIAPLTTASSTASGSGSGGGGAVTIDYLYTSGTDGTATGVGWGVGPWGGGTWGTPRVGSSATTGSTRIWKMDNFGEDMIMCAKDGAVFYWDATVPQARMIYLTAASGATQPPEIATTVLVSQVSRHAVAFGCDPLGSSTQSKLLVRWSDQEDVADWVPSTINQAGDMLLNRGSRIVTAVQNRSDIYIFTDRALYNMQYIGGQLVFGFNVVADNIYIAGSNAAVVLGDAIFWMGKFSFSIFDGAVKNLPCTVQDFLNLDVDWDYSEKIFAATNSTFNEVLWFYQSVDGTEVDSYVAYNYAQNLWYYGHLDRTAWCEDPVSIYPIAAQSVTSGTFATIWDHEIGDWDNQANANLGAYIESAPIEVDDGNSFVFVNRFLPDFDFAGSTGSSPYLNVTLTAYNYPGGPASSTSTTKVVAQTSANNHTRKNDVRLRGRMVKVKVQEPAGSAAATDAITWGLGDIRLDVRQDGAK